MNLPFVTIDGEDAKTSMMAYAPPGRKWVTFGSQLLTSLLMLKNNH